MPVDVVVMKVADDKSFLNLKMALLLQRFLVCVLILAILSQNVSAADRPALGRVLQNLKKNSTNSQEISEALDHRLIKLRSTEYPIGLAKANIEEFPWLVTVKAEDNRHSCVGALLSSEWALIPATCGVSFHFFFDSVTRTEIKFSFCTPRKKSKTN